MRLNPIQKETISTVRSFGDFVLKNKREISPKFFADEFGYLERKFAKKGNIDTFCGEADMLADRLYDNYLDDFVGIIMSTLCKTNEFRPNALEFFAWKGFDIARMNRDFVHMMARLNDLRKIYSNNPDTFNSYMDVLYRQEHCLHKLTRYYDDTSKTFRSAGRLVAPRYTYENMLANIQTEIGKITKYSHPKDARYKLQSAYSIFKQHGNEKKADYVEKLLDDLDRNIESKAPNFF